MKKWMALIVAGITAFSLCACGEEKDTSVSSVLESGKLKVGLVQTNSSYTQYDEETDTYSGLEPELADVFSSAMGVQTEFVEVSRDQLATAFQNKQIDIALGCIAQGDSIASEYASTSYYASGYIYVVTNRGNYHDTFGSFEGTTVGIFSGMSESSKSQISNISAVTTKEYTNLESVKTALASGEIEGYFCYENEAQILMQTGLFQPQNVAGSELERYTILTDKSAINLQAALNSMLSQYKAIKEEEAASEENVEESAEGDESEGDE